MKKLKEYNVSTLFLSCCILSGLIFPILFNLLDISSYNNSINDSDNLFIYSSNGREYKAKYITAQDVEEMKQDIDTQTLTPRSESNVIIDGHGTGYNINPDDLESLVGKVSLLDVIPKADQKYRATADLSTEIYFPAVGDQGSQGSCSAWANAYYAYGYLEAKDYGWDASSGNPDYLLSPAWAYNIVSAYDYGSIPYEVAQVLLDWGVPTLSAMPYDDSDVDSWGDETAWRQAPYHRPLDYTLITYTGPATIDLMKSLITSGVPVTIGIDAYQFSIGLDEVTMDFILSSDEYDSTSLNHAQCLVGYDDVITEGSDVGAFRVVNSWGDTWMDNGYYWLTYDAFAEFAGLSGQVIMYIEDRIDYNPNIIATWEFSSAPTRMDDIITLGVGPHNNPLNSMIPLYDNDVNNLFPDFMALDISDFYSYYTIDNNVFFFLEVGLSDTTGIISSFRLERYLGGVLQEISKESPDVPKSTPGYVNGTFKIFLHELRVVLEVPTDPMIYYSYQIEATVINNGGSDESSVYFELLLNSIVVDSITIPSLLSGTNATISYIWTPTEYDLYNFTAQTPPISGEDYPSNNVATELLPILGPIFFDDFETGLSKWVSSTGLWHLTDGSSIWSDPYHSPTHSMWFGNESTGNYDTGFRESGDLISIPINLASTGFASLEFYHWREGEGYGYDESLVYISTNGVNWNLIYANDISYTAPWEKVSVDISAYVGYPSVQLRFTFDTYDAIMNDYRGWLIDDVAIMGTGVVIPHNLRVILEVPENPEISKSYNINATVTNIGSSDETNINLFLYENGILGDSLYIANLLSGSSQTINYFWMPTSYGDYNFTAFAPPVSGEGLTYDNLVTKFVHLHEVILFDGMYLNYNFNLANIYIGPTQVLYTQISGSKFHALWEGVLSGLPLINHWDVDTQTRIMENGGGNFYFGDNSHTPIWTFTDISISDLVYIAVDGEGDHTFLVSGDIIYDIPYFGPVEAWVLEDLTLPGGIAYYEKSTGILIKGTFGYAGGMYNYTFDLTDTNALLNRIVFDHDLRVNLGTPSYCELYNTYTISATIINTGTNDETGVDLFLYLDEVIIDSVHISSLTSGSSQTIDYSWTPMDYGDYNFTAYAPPVTGETYTSDNRKTKIIPLHKTILFEGMFLNYSFTLWGESYPLEYLYSYVSDGIFHVDYSLYVGGLPQTGYWDVNSQTRVMTNSYGGISFGSGTHTPLWIFTDISLSDVIAIAVDAEGDHNFIVSDEVTYDLPGFGSVDAWVLEDSTVPGGFALYEKITGILLNGTFFFSGGANNYSFELFNTNVFVKSLTVALPDSSSSCAVGTSEDICWTSHGLIYNVKIELYKDDAFVMVISSNTPNDGLYSWAIPSNLATSNKYQIKISDVADPSVSDFSEYFEIKASEGGISGYNIIFFVTILGVFSLIVTLRKKRKST